MYYCFPFLYLFMKVTLRQCQKHLRLLDTKQCRLVRSFILGLHPDPSLQATEAGRRGMTILILGLGSRTTHQQRRTSKHLSARPLSQDNATELCTCSTVQCNAVIQIYSLCCHLTCRKHWNVARVFLFLWQVHELGLPCRRRFSTWWPIARPADY